MTQPVKKLLFDRVLVRPTPLEEKTKSGLIIPKMALANMKSTTGTIIALGTGTKDEPLDEVAVGDMVLYPEESGIDIELNGDMLKILPIKMVICIL